MFESGHGLLPGESALFVNGLQINLEVYDIFALIEAMKSEAKILEGLHSLGFKVCQFFNTGPRFLRDCTP